MQYPVNLPGLEGRNLVVETSPWSNPKLLLDGSLAPAGPKRNQYAIKPNHGIHEVLVELQTTFPDTIPVVYANGNEFRIAEPLGKFALVWAALPVLLIFVGVVTGGGLLGAILGGMAVAANLQAMRSNLPIPTRYVISGIFSFAAFIIWLTINIVINGTWDASSTQASTTPADNATANTVSTPAPGAVPNGSTIPGQ